MEELDQAAKRFKAVSIPGPVLSGEFASGGEGSRQGMDENVLNALVGGGLQLQFAGLPGTSSIPGGGPRRGMGIASTPIRSVP
jgi:hypothetical protein